MEADLFHFAVRMVVITRVRIERSELHPSLAHGRRRFSEETAYIGADLEQAAALNSYYDLDTRQAFLDQLFCLIIAFY